VTATLPEFEQVIYADFEFVAKPGEPPDVVCLAWREEPSGQTYRLWRDQLGDVPPYRTDARVLFVCFVGNAELHCHLALGWPLPVNVLDLNGRVSLRHQRPHGTCGQRLVGGAGLLRL
jgi:DNA polymerase I